MDTATSKRWGATEAEWSHFAGVLGCLPDLLPVVSNPHARISPSSTLRALGKTPSRYTAARRVVGFPKWTLYEATATDLDRWMAEPDYGICIQTREIRALDVDIDDPLHALEVACTFLKELGESAAKLPVRFRENSGRLLLPVRVPGHVAKSIIKVRGGGAIEILGHGQQFIAAGVHPSGERYRWTNLAQLLDARLGLA